MDMNKYTEGTDDGHEQVYCGEQATVMNRYIEGNRRWT